MLDDRDQIAQHVPDRDRLAAGVHPLGRHHHREHLGEVPQHLEARGAGADDDRGAQLDRLDRSGREPDPDLVAAPQVVAQLAGVRAEPAEVHDATDPGRLGRGAEVLGDRILAFDPVRALADAVHEEHRHVDPVHRGREIAGDVTRDHLHLGAPRCRVELAGITRQAPHPVPVGEELGHEPAADVTGRSGDEHAAGRWGHPAHRRGGRHATPLRTIAGPARSRSAGASRGETLARQLDRGRDVAPRTAHAFDQRGADVGRLGGDPLRRAARRCGAAGRRPRARRSPRRGRPFGPDRPGPATCRCGREQRRPRHRRSPGRAGSATPRAHGPWSATPRRSPRWSCRSWEPPSSAPSIARVRTGR